MSTVCLIEYGAVLFFVFVYFVFIFFYVCFYFCLICLFLFLFAHYMHVLCTSVPARVLAITHHHNIDINKNVVAASFTREKLAATDLLSL